MAKAKAKPTKMLAILGRCRRTGHWRVASRSSVLAVFGSCNLDMRRSFVEGDSNLKIQVTVVFGSATFLLPDGAEVKPSGVSMLASSLVDVPEHEEECELPTVDIEWLCMFGRLRVVTEEALHRMEAEPEPEPVETPADLDAAAAGLGGDNPAAVDAGSPAAGEPEPVTAGAG